MVVSKDHITLNYLKFSYQIISLKDLEEQHKQLSEDKSLKS